MTARIPSLLARTIHTVGLARALSVGLALALGSGGCGKPPAGGVDIVPSGPDDTRLAFASVSPMGATGDDVSSWESVPWRDEAHPEVVRPWIPYPGHVQLQVHHEQGRIPRAVLVYLSFVENGQNPALAAGDLARVVDVNEEFVTVWNDTNGAYFARVVLLF